METRLCRICGKLGQNYVHLFKTEGLKNKVETCLPIVVSPHSLLPDTICGECSENVDNFYSFIKNCLQNIIILEAQYDITNSCLKTKRKHEKGCMADITVLKQDKSIQTDDYLDILLQQINENESSNATNFPFGYSLTQFNDNHSLTELKHKLLVDYDIETDSSDVEESNQKDAGKVVLTSTEYILSNRMNDLVNTILAPSKCNITLGKQYFDDAENDLISEIAQRKTLKRKCDTIESRRTKMFKLDTSNKRKCKRPKKVECKAVEIKQEVDEGLDFVMLEKMYDQIDDEGQQYGGSCVEVVKPEGVEKPNIYEQETDVNAMLPQTCLLCTLQFPGPSALAAHVFEMHGIDMAQIISSVENSNNDKKKKLPNLVKISDLKRSDSIEESQETDQVMGEEPAFLLDNFTCSNCFMVFSSKPELFTHLRSNHAEEAALTCGLCLYTASSYLTLASHVESCSLQIPLTTKYYCQICKYGEDSSKLLEQHIPVHTFLLDLCRKQSKMFDPEEYIQTNDDVNPAHITPTRSLTCNDCGQTNFDSFKDFSTHRRSQHSIFHCDLCNKFYGRNSHLWKHVNRLHKGHPSITCQLCYKTSASKYHLSQHFNKIHSQKPCKSKQNDLQLQNDNSTEDFMSQKFQAFDFQSVKQSFMRQEILEQEKKLLNEEGDENSNQLSDEELMEDKGSAPTQRFVEPPYAPKEIDASSDLYTNIITNYTPPVNEGEFKCPKCGKGFHKKTLLKKHKKNCRPRLQKDLLTRCKSCARIFKDRQSLAKHLVNYHSEYACELCGQKVQSKCEIVAHIRFTHPTCHLVCSICGNILRSRADLAEHKKDHANSYICQFCADSLPSKIKLKMHILSLHRKILSLSCGICLKLFETQHVLRDHVRLVHKDQLAPLTSCPVCGKNYGSKWKTYDHLNKSHGRIFKACKACLEVFNTEYELQSHYDLVHGSVPSTNSSKNIVSSINNVVNSSGVNQQNMNVKMEYQSESEQENDDNSEQSNDLENYNSYHDKRSDSEDQKSNEYVNFPELSPAHSKISLLEKRLMGKKITEDDMKFTTQKKQKSSNSTVGNNKQANTNSQSCHKTLDKKHENKNKSSSNSFNSFKQEIDEHNDSNPNNTSNPQHNSSKRTVYVNSNDPSLCEICLKTWPAKKHLWQHYIRCHKSVAATVCGICLKTNPDYAALQQHLVETHPTLLHGQGFGSNFICRICGRYHNASSKLKLHMAIHENFDWSLLEGNLSKQSENKGDDQSNGYQYHQYMFKKDEEINGDENEIINYESLIEQVECSESDNEDDNEESNMAATQNQSSSEGEDQDEDDDDEEEEGEDAEDEEESENESCCSEPSLESQMLKNMLREKQLLLNNTEGNSNNKNSDSSESDDSSNSSFSDTEENNENSKQDNGECSSDEMSGDSHASSSSQNKSESSEEVAMSPAEGNNMFIRKPDELDSAIKSISYMNSVNEIDNDVDDDYCEMQQHLNENEIEIESAVGSIL